MIKGKLQFNNDDYYKLDEGYYKFDEIDGFDEVIIYIPPFYNIPLS